MAWTTPYTFVALDVLTATQLNTVQDNITYLYSTATNAAIACPSIPVDQYTAGTGDGRAYLGPLPAKVNGMNWTGLLITGMTKGTSGTASYMIARGRQAGSAGTGAFVWVDALGTAYTIDANEYSGTSAAAAYSINTSYDDVQTGDFFRVDCDAITTGLAGVYATFTFTTP